ncbi:ATPase [Cladorrhinum sp. PSN259]|nr:ATPase [Cladorrhinum sp. PSN259]
MEGAMEASGTCDSGIDDEIEESAHTSTPSPRKPWIRYRTEWRHSTTDELLSRRDADEPQTEEALGQAGVEEPVFELVTTYRTRVMDQDDTSRQAHATTKGIYTAKDPVVVTNLLAKPQHHLNIYSQAIVNALQSVVKYYPSQSLSADPVVVPWPYPILVHHYDKLATFRDAVVQKNVADRCIMEKDVEEHISLLLDFLDDNVMEGVRVEQERLKRGTYTWEYLWLSHKPGVAVVEQYMGESTWSVSVINSVYGGTFDQEGDSSKWLINYWVMAYDGACVGRVLQTASSSQFDGEASRQVFFLDMSDMEEGKLDNIPQAARDRIKQGETWFRLLKKQCKHYKGKAAEFPHNNIDGLVMLDLKGYYTNAEGLQPPRLMDISDCRPTLADGTCAFCKDKAKGDAKETGEKRTVALFSDYRDIDIDDHDSLSDFQYLLCPVEIPGFVFKTRKWEFLYIDNLSEPVFEEDMINGLVMDESRKRTLKSLAKSFARRNKSDQQISKSMWSADFVKGKGGGLIFLLHGTPGVGKTCTAECIAAFTRRPLMVLTSSDIGTLPSQVEIKLTKMFKTAMSWDAVLLIDEADVFMERRTATNLERNTLVAAFLRALEFFDGILFLTTNRIGSFDDAFISRVHVQLYFPEFTNEQRQLVWKTFMDKLARERGDYIRLNIDAKEYIRGAEMRAVEWNGREIRNALQTAVALAEYDAEKDEEGKILVTDTHLKAVVEMSRDFKNYLNELHRGNEAKRAERRYERLAE